jgi:hypothetical protein
MKGSRAKLAIFYAVLVFGVFAVAELLALATYVIAFHEPFSYDRLQSQRLTLFRPAGASPGPGRTEERPNTGGPVEGVSSRGLIDGPLRVIHPYYGFVSNPGSPLVVDKFGFLGHADQIQAANPNKLVVAIVGGSVAARLAFRVNSEDLLETELKRIPEFRNKRIIIINLGNGAFKQPQGLITINDILSRGGHIDILIALDGFNEIALPEAHGNLGDGISPFYPQHWRQLAESQLYPGQMSALAKLQYLSALRVILAENFAKPVIRHLVLANLIWRVADEQMQIALARYRISLDQQPPTDPLNRLTNDQRAFLGPTVEYTTRRELYMDIARQWARSSVLMNDIIADQGGRYFHFLQPNQYVSGSKPMSQEEKRFALKTTSPYRRPVEIGYPYLRRMGASLRRAGLWFEDLTGLFADNGEELYIDDCCHLNEQGNAILARAIAGAIATRVGTGDKARPVALGQVDFSDDLFAAQELLRFVLRPADYNDGSRDFIGAASKVTAPNP